MKFVEFENLEKGYSVVNIGSGPSKYNFYWSEIKEVKGYNFAVAPEDFRYDARIIKNYREYLRDGGIVLIIICPLSFAENAFLDKESFSYKYVKILPPEDVDISLLKYKLLNNLFIYFIYDKFLFFENILFKLSKIFKRHNTLKTSPEGKLVEGWIKDNPYLQNLKDIPEKDLSYIFRKKKHDLKNVINECLTKSLKPVIILPPMSKKLYSYFSDKFLKKFVYDNLEEISEKTLILDYMTDERFNKEEYFTNGLFLKTDYAKQFTNEVWQKIKKMIEN